MINECMYDVCLYAWDRIVKGCMDKGGVLGWCL